MRAFRLVAGLAGLASALPLLFLGEGGIDGFVVSIVALQFAPFGLLIAIAGFRGRSAGHRQLSAVARWFALALAATAYVALAYLPFIVPKWGDPQQGLVFLFLPFYLVAFVLLVWLTDAVARAVRRRVRRQES